jgi:hypothetical protein
MWVLHGNIRIMCVVLVLKSHNLGQIVNAFCASLRPPRPNDFMTLHISPGMVFNVVCFVQRARHVASGQTERSDLQAFPSHCRSPEMQMTLLPVLEFASRVSSRRMPVAKPRRLPEAQSASLQQIKTRTKQRRLHKLAVGSTFQASPMLSPASLNPHGAFPHFFSYTATPALMVISSAVANPSGSR